MQITVQSITPNDSAFVLVEHNWAAPDSFKTPDPNYKLSPYHYWKVSGIVPALFDATGTITYDGRALTGSGGGYLDDQLLTKTNQEDSIVLMYRKNASDDWNLFPYCTKTKGNITDKYGILKIDSLLLGEYTIAFAYKLGAGITENVVKNSILVYPNPFSESTTIKIASIRFASGNLPFSGYQVSGIKIYDVLGKEVKAIITRNSDSFVIHRGSLLNGIYFLKIQSADATIIATGKIVIQ
jgi:hypothetical protein